MYYLYRFYDAWSVLDEEEGTNTTLEQPEIDMLKKHFPKILKDKSKLVKAFHIVDLPMKKLDQIAINAAAPNNKKISDPSVKN